MSVGGAFFMCSKPASFSPAPVAALLSLAAEIAPILLGRSEHKKMHVAAAPEFSEQLEVKGRQRAEAENTDPRWKRLVRAGRRLGCVLSERSWMRVSRREPSPKLRLPRMLRVVLAEIPGAEQHGPVGEISIKDGRHLPRELPELHRIPACIAAEAGKGEFLPQLGEKRMNAPGQD